MKACDESSHCVEIIKVSVFFLGGGRLLLLLSGHVNRSCCAELFSGLTTGRTAHVQYSLCLYSVYHLTLSYSSKSVFRQVTHLLCPDSGAKTIQSLHFSLTWKEEDFTWEKQQP